MGSSPDEQYHVFNCAVCMSTLILKNPQNALAPFALAQIDSATNLFGAALTTVASPRMVQNLQWLLSIRARCSAKIEAGGSSGGQNSNVSHADDSNDDHGELIGWRTRLIQRASNRVQTAKTIQRDSPSLSTTTVSPNTLLTSTITDAIKQQFANTNPSGIGSAPLPTSGNDSTTDALVNTATHEYRTED